MSGELPPGWELTHFRDLARLIRGVTFSGKDVFAEPGNGRIAILRAGNLQAGQILRDDLIYVSRNFVSDDQILRRGDLVIAMSSGSRAIVGKAGAFDGAYKDIISFGAFCGAVRPITNDLAPWLGQFLQTKEYRDQVSAFAVGVNINNLRPSHLEQLVIPVAPLSEQRRIVERVEALLAKGAQAKAALDALPPLLDRYRQSLLAAAFRGELTADWRSLRGENDGDVHLPGNWTETQLQTLIIEGPTNGYSPKSGEDATGTPTLKLTATTRGKLDLSPEATKRVHETIPPGSKYWLQPGDILVQRANSIEHVGATAIFDGPPNAYIYPDLMMRVRVENSDIARYLWRLLNSPSIRKFFRDRATGTAGNMPKISGAILREVPVPLPPIEELREINRRLDQAEAKAARVLAQVKALTSHHTTLTQSILAKAFRGELVPQDPADEPASVLLERIRAGQQKTMNKNQRISTKRETK